MVFLHAHERSRLLEYIRNLAPEPVTELGLSLAEGGAVKECSKAGTNILGTVRADAQEAYTVKLEVLTGRNINAHCSCYKPHESDAEGMHHAGWCAHAIALLWRANDLGFFASDSGFAARESTFRIHTLTAQDVAAALHELNQVTSPETGAGAHCPEVAILLDLGTDRLGVQVLFDDEIQEAALFDGYRPTSGRMLDNLLLEILDEEGAWDEGLKLWYVNSSKGISLILGLLGEYREILSVRSRKRVSIATLSLEAKLKITWQRSGAELEMCWLLPDGSSQSKHSDLMGSGPYWVTLDNTIYPVTQAAARIASLFPHGGEAIFPRSQVGPIVEALHHELYDPRRLVIENQALQPLSEVKSPVPVLELQRKDISQEHFSSARKIEVQANLDFEYPSPPLDENIVYLPDRPKEREHTERLLSLGFEQLRDKNRFVVADSLALDLISSSSEIFPEDWKLNGLDQLRKGIRFADVSVDISISTPTLPKLQEEGEDAPYVGKIDWFDCHISVLLNNAHVPLSTLFKTSNSDNDRWIRLENGAFAKVPGGSLGQLKTTLGMLDPNYRLTNNIKARLSTAQALGLTRLTDTNISLSLDRSLKKLSRQLDNFEGLSTVKLSKSFKGTLRPYQRDGLNWLHFLYQFELGGILADEMGLGKTVQTLALLQVLRDEATRKKRRWKPVLVVAPTSVITNWVYEAKRFTPKLSVALLHGSGRRALFSRIAEYDLVITSYALLRLDRYDLERFQYGYVILDEAQHIKNFQAATTLAAKSLKSERRLALSGTPTENRPMELWSLVDFLMPGLLGSYDFFRSNIEKPILEIGPHVPVARLLQAKTKPFILRRIKSEVEKDLPPKIETVLRTPMTPSQRELYAHILEEVRPRVFDAVAKKGVAGASISILAALLRLRQVCNHPNSIDALKDAPGYDSGKFFLLKDLLEEALPSGRKILLFGQFKEMLAIIRRYLDEQNVSYLYMDGSTRNRQELIDRFNQDDSVRLFLISLKAGGLGLNLTAADMVVIYDPWWNPAVESQAVDRAHRIGQRKTVYVYRLVTDDSVEQRIMDLKRKKAAIVDALINERGLSTLNFSKGDLEALFMPLKDGGE